MALDLSQCGYHNFPEVTLCEVSTLQIRIITQTAYLILCVERHHSGFVRPYNCFAGTDHILVGLGRQLVGQEQQNQASLEQILLIG